MGKGRPEPAAGPVGSKNRVYGEILVYGEGELLVCGEGELLVCGERGDG